MKPTLDLIGLGECMVEFSAEQPLGQAQTLHKAYGGDVLNSLLMATRLGSRCGFISRVGHDPFGAGLREAWQAEGLDIECAPLVAGDNGVYFISLLEGGEREFSYRRAGSAASQLSPAGLNPAYLARGRMLLLSGITQAISGSAEAATLHAAQLARAKGLKLAYDPNYRPRLWELRGGLAAAQAAFDQLLPLVDILLPSHPADSHLWGAAEQTPLVALDSLPIWPALIGMKVGAEGAWMVQAGKANLIPAVQPTAERDTTGAGDAWNGAFLHGLLKGQPTLNAAQVANQIAATKIAFRGAIPPRDFWPNPPA